MSMRIFIEAVAMFFNVIRITLFARVLLSWFPMAHGSTIVRLLFSITEPILAPIRNMIQKSPLGGPGMIIDFSPIIAFILIHFIQMFLLNILRGLL